MNIATASFLKACRNSNSSWDEIRLVAYFIAMARVGSLLLDVMIHRNFSEQRGYLAPRNESTSLAYISRLAGGVGSPSQ